MKLKSALISKFFNDKNEFIFPLIVTYVCKYVKDNMYF